MERLKNALGKVMHTWKRLERGLVQITTGNDYNAYLKHFKEHHKGEEPLSKEEFYKMMSDSGGKRPRCC